MSQKMPVIRNIFKAVMHDPSPGDIHDVSHRAPASVQHGGPAAIDVDGHWQGQLPEAVPENLTPRSKPFSAASTLAENTLSRS
jgi:hypothetical protein